MDGVNSITDNISQMTLANLAELIAVNYRRPPSISPMNSLQSIQDYLLLDFTEWREIQTTLDDNIRRYQYSRIETIGSLEFCALVADWLNSELDAGLHFKIRTLQSRLGEKEVGYVLYRLAALRMCRLKAEVS